MQSLRSIAVSLSAASPYRLALALRAVPAWSESGSVVRSEQGWPGKEPAVARIALDGPELEQENLSEFNWKWYVSFPLKALFAAADRCDARDERRSCCRFLRGSGVLLGGNGCVLLQCDGFEVVAFLLHGVGGSTRLPLHGWPRASRCSSGAAEFGRAIRGPHFKLCGLLRTITR